MQTPIDWTKPIETVKGHPARIIGTFKGKDYTRSVAVTLGGIEVPHSYTESGHYWPHCSDFDFNLRNVAPKMVKRKIWVNVYADPFLKGQYGMSRAQADSFAFSCRQHCVETEIEFPET